MPATPDAPAASELHSTTPEPGPNEPVGSAVTAPADGAAAVPAAQPPTEPLNEASSEPVAAPARRARATRGGLDAVCAAAVDPARAAAAEMAGEAAVGEHEGVVPEGDRVVTHFFTCLLPGYRGWRWAVTTSRVPRARVATISEVVLLPGAGALLPPPWVPWSDRVAPGDLGPHDQLPYRADDPYLEAGYAPVDRAGDAVEVAVGSAELPTDDAGRPAAAPVDGDADDEADRLAVWELGLGRRRVLSREGREAAAARWYTGEHGPQADSAQHAPAPCASCGYFLPMAGAMRRLFGVCANAWSPDDGKVVSLDHGCGAHSETDVEHPEPEPLPSLILDETGAEAVVVPPRPVGEPVEPAAEPVAEPVAEGATADEAGPDTSGDPVAEQPEAVVPETVVPDAGAVPTDGGVDPEPTSTSAP